MGPVELAVSLISAGWVLLMLVAAVAGVYFGVVEPLLRRVRIALLSHRAER